MISRMTMFVLVIAAATALAACGGGSDDSETQDSAPSTEGGSDTTVEAPVETTAADDSDDDAMESTDNDASGCDQVVSPEEIDSIFGGSVEITGEGERCSLVFASDAIGGLAAFSGAKADEAIEALLAQFESNGSAENGGVLLGDSRGYVKKDSVAVRGDSGRVFSIGIPDGIDVTDRLGAMQALADLLLTR